MTASLLLRKTAEVVFFLCGIIALVAASTAFTRFQQDADTLRLRHLQYYNDLIERYYKIKGFYPLQNNDPKTPVYVFIANSNQQKFTHPGPPFAHLEVSCREFIAELEKVLGKKIDEFYDPQDKPEKKPNFYIYMVRGDRYAITVHLHNEYPFARRKAAGYNTVTVSNRSTSATYTILPRRLFANKVYKKAAAAAIVDKPFFDSLKERYLHDSKKSRKTGRTNRPAAGL